VRVRANTKVVGTHTTQRARGKINQKRLEIAKKRAREKARKQESERTRERERKRAREFVC